MKRNALYVGNTTEIYLSELSIGGVPIGAGATVTALVNDTAGDAVTGFTNPVTMTLVVGTEGSYSGSILHSAVLTIGQNYDIIVSATTADGVGQWTGRLKAQQRKL